MLMRSRFCPPNASAAQPRAARKPHLRQAGIVARRSSVCSGLLGRLSNNRGYTAIDTGDAERAQDFVRRILPQVFRSDYAVRKTFGAANYLAQKQHVSAMICGHRTIFIRNKALEQTDSVFQLSAVQVTD